MFGKVTALWKIFTKFGREAQNSSNTKSVENENIYQNLVVRKRFLKESLRESLTKFAKLKHQKLSKK
jgi:hypothetical protein